MVTDKPKTGWFDAGITGVVAGVVGWHTSNVVEVALSTAIFNACTATMGVKGVFAGTAAVKAATPFIGWAAGAAGGVAGGAVVATVLYAKGYFSKPEEPGKLGKGLPCNYPYNATVDVSIPAFVYAPKNV